MQCTDSHGATPFIVAVKQGLGELVTLLIDRGASKDDLSKVFTFSIFIVPSSLFYFASSLFSCPPFPLLSLSFLYSNCAQGMRMAASRGHKDVVKRILSVFDNDDVLAFLMLIGVNITDSGASLEDERNCAVCMENARDAVAVPCGHTACCYSCMESLPTPRLCPICRVEVRLVQKMYLFIPLLSSLPSLPSSPSFLPLPLLPSPSFTLHFSTLINQ